MTVLPSSNSTERSATNIGDSKVTNPSASAVLIPDDVLTTASIPAWDKLVATALIARTRGTIFYAGNSRQMPRFLVVGSSGLLAVGVTPLSAAEIVRISSSCIILTGDRRADPLGDLGASTTTLLQTLRGQLRRPPKVKLVFTNIDDAAFASLHLARYVPRTTAVLSNDLAQTAEALFPHTDADALSDSAIVAIRERLFPEARFMRRPRFIDSNLNEQKNNRIFLDAQQESVARSFANRTILSGVAGSGKSLILCARARFLAREHPAWEVVVLCFNQTLVKYLRELIGPASNVAVSTFHALLQSLKISISYDPASALHNSQAFRNAIDRGVGVSSCDAVLIDEGQDFAAEWIEFAAKMLRPGRGGLVIARDPAQSIYQSTPAVALSFERRATHVALTTSYRTTKQIGMFALSSVFGLEDPAHDQTASPTYLSDGPKVKMVFSHTRMTQAEFIGLEICRLVREKHAGYGDIAILLPYYRGCLGVVTCALTARDIPYAAVTWEKASKLGFDIARDCVKVMTIHSSKGLEFPIVFLFAADAISLLDTQEEREPAIDARARLPYVAMTRSQDTLYLTFSRSTPMLDRSRSLTEYCETFVYPEDFDYKDRNG